MEASALNSLLVELFAAIKLVSGYPAPATIPEVTALPAVEIQKRLCAGRPCQIAAFYHPEWGVIVDETLDFANNPFDRSILLHELVHHLQKTTGKFDSLVNFCNRRTAEELEAYEIQNRYLSSIHSSRRAIVMGWTGKCDPEGAD